GGGLSPEREYVYGARDRMDERYDIIRTVRDKRYRYIRNYETFKPYYQYMNTPEKGPTMRELRRVHAEGKLPPEAELFMADTKPPEELYDSANDPHEVRNLVSDPAQRAVLDRMRAAHGNWMDETRDVGLIPEPELIEREKKLGNRYAILRQDGMDEMLPRLRKVADLAVAGVSAVAELEKALDDEESAVRYWAAIGLGNIGADATAALESVKKATQDTSAVVRIAASRALSTMGRPGEAIPVLERELASEAEWVRLHAAIVLDLIGEQARPAIPALKKALDDKQNKYVVRVANRALNDLEGTDRVVP
ncbi:MAG: sulfatase, partial [bacterium]|nr:sulfatase [bacterium]